MEDGIAKNEQTQESTGGGPWTETEAERRDQRNEWTPLTSRLKMLQKRTWEDSHQVQKLNSKRDHLVETILGGRGEMLA